MKILFICKANRFRSKVAEAYFKKINKNKKIIASSTGIIELGGNLSDYEKKKNQFIYDEFGLKLGGVSRGITIKMLRENDKIVVVAKDIGKEIFDNPKWKDKVQYWGIEDEKGDGDKTRIRKIIKEIMSKVDKLNEELK